MNDLIKIEQEIKHYFLPYQTILKVTQIGRFLDDSDMLVDNSGDGFQYTFDFDLK